jgi:hypothetical protein
MGRLGHHRGRRKGRLPQTPGRQARPRGRPQEAHPDQPLQRSPAWLDLAHKALDAAVAAAYGWADYTPAMPDDEILRRLLALNLERAQA